MSEISNDPFARFDLPGQSIQQRPSDRVIEEFCKSYNDTTNIESLADSMKQYDKNVINIQITRQKLANKLMSAVMGMDLSVDEHADPDTVIAKSKILAEARGLLNDLDSSAKNHTATKLKYKDSETQANAVFNAADLLSKIKISIDQDMKAAPTSTTEIEAGIEKQFENKNCTILETELETGGNKLPHGKADTTEE